MTKTAKPPKLRLTMSTGVNPAVMEGPEPSSGSQLILAVDGRQEQSRSQP